jgi:hypothetical protein
MDSSSNAQSLRGRILALRYKNKSYREIAQRLGISKGTVSYWLTGDEASQAIKRMLTERQLVWSRKHMATMAREASKRWEAWRATARADAARQFSALVRRPLFVSGITMYWGEGDSKLGNPLRLSNTDPRMIRLYVQFLRGILGVPKHKIRLALILYPDLNDTTCRKFWSITTSLPLACFLKTQYIRGHHPTKRLEHGICVVVVNSRQLKEKVCVWIDLLSKKIRMVGSRSRV